MAAPHRRGKAEERFKAMDVNGHGYITKEEFCSGRGMGRRGMGRGIGQVYGARRNVGDFPESSTSAGVKEAFSQYPAKKLYTSNGAPGIYPSCCCSRLKTKIDESHPLIERTSRISFKYLEQYET